MDKLARTEKTPLKHTTVQKVQVVISFLLICIFFIHGACVQTHDTERKNHPQSVVALQSPSSSPHPIGSCTWAHTDWTGDSNYDHHVGRIQIPLSSTLTACCSMELAWTHYISNWSYRLSWTHVTSVVNFLNLLSSVIFN